MAVSTVIKVDSVAIDRDAVDVVPASLVLGNPDGPDTFEFEHRGSTAQAYAHRLPVVVEVNDGLGGGAVVRFRGRITGAAPKLDGHAGWHYSCEGGAYLADQVSVSHPQRGIGYLVFNAPPTDEADYDAGLVGLSVGDILEFVLTIDEIATDLWGAGIEAYTAAPPYDTVGLTPPVLKAATVADIATLTTVPLEAVRFAGQRLWSQLQDLIRTYAPTFRLRVRADGTIRCTDTRTLTPRILTIGTDPIKVPELKRESTDCASAIRVRGRDLVEGMWFTLAEGDLEEDWTEIEEVIWTWDDFANPVGGYAAADITAMGTDTATVEVTDGLEAWAADYWPDIQAHVTLIEDAASGSITYQITRRIVSNTSLTGGGTSVLTLDLALPPSPGYNRAEIVGVAGGSHVHRRYVFEATRQDAAARIVNRFPFPVATGDLGLGYQAAMVTSVPYGWNVKASSTLAVGAIFPLQFSIFTDPDDSLVKIITSDPTCEPWTQQGELDIGGEAVTKPDDIRVFVPVSKGPLEVRVPSSSYEGRAYTVHGLEYEQTVDLDGWLYVADEARAAAFAQDLLDSLKDPILSGTIEYLGFDAAAVAAGGIEAIELECVAAFDDLDGDLSGVPLPVHSVEVRWNTAPGNATIHSTIINVNTRTFPYHGNRQNEPKGYADINDPLGFADLARVYGVFTDQGGHGSRFLGGGF